jgi:tryptophanyl-tRNA synthetase
MGFSGEETWCVFGDKLCGFRPTGKLHLGHYFSVILPGKAGASVLVANYHAPGQEIKNSIELLNKFGVSKIIIQKDVFNAEFYFKLLSISAMGDLERMTQYKSSSNPSAHLLTYPVLMTHDVAGFKKVLVGEDQTQHLQYASKLLKKYNRVFSEDFVIPEPEIVVGRIKDLKNPSVKMSKSNPGGCLFLDDSYEEISLKLKKATTDKNGMDNLCYLYSCFVGGEIPSMNLELKERLSESIFNKLRS